MSSLPSQIPFEMAVRIVNREYVSEENEEATGKAGGAEMGSEFSSAGTENSIGKEQKKYIYIYWGHWLQV